MNGAIYVSDSKNEKISGKSKVDATYASIKATCSPTCPFQKDSTCYAKQSFVGMVVNRLDKKARNYSPLKLAQAEARCIDESYGGGKVPEGRDLRIHVSGDSRTIAGTRLINNAIKRWKKRGGRDCWSYTHSWSHVLREEWSAVSILASIESVNQVEAARQNGYACAIVVEEHPSDKAFKIDGCETTWIPCPAQTKDNVSCSSCRLCMKADWLHDTNKGIAFAAHGIKQSDMKRHLKVLK